VSALELNLPRDLGGLSPIRVCGIEDDEQPVDIEELLPIRISSLIELESEGSRAVGVVTTRLGSEGELADPESSMSDATNSPPESDYEDEAESESSERDRGESGQPDPSKESTSVPVPVVQLEEMDDSDDPARVGRSNTRTNGSRTVRPGCYCGTNRRSGTSLNWPARTSRSS